MQYDYSILTKTTVTDDHLGKPLVYCAVFQNPHDNKTYYYIGSKKKWINGYYGSLKRNRIRKAIIGNQYLADVQSGATNISIYVLEVVGSDVPVTKTEREFQMLYNAKHNIDFINISYAANRRWIPGSTKGLIVVNNGQISKMITEAELAKDSTWTRGRLIKHQHHLTDTIRINNGLRHKAIKESELTYFESLGWVKGRLPIESVNPLKGKICITDGQSYKRIAVQDLAYYESLGWHKGLIVSGTTGMVSITNGTINMYVKPEELQTYILNGWTKGRKMSKDTRIAINNIISTKFININELQQYLDAGWTKGRKLSNTKSNT